MSILDQLTNIPSSIGSSFANSLGFLPDRGYYHNTFYGGNHILIKPLDVSASRLFENLSTNLKVRGNSTNKQNKLGFTPELDIYTDPNNIDPKTKYPVERGVILEAGNLSSGTPESSKPKYGNLRDTADILTNDIPNAFNAFNDTPGELFLHNLDIYLTSGEFNLSDNEDPVSFGYDIIINYDNSPLFNGAIEDFITTFSSYTEVKTRMDIIKEFKANFFRFFKVTAPTQAEQEHKTTVTNSNTLRQPIVRTYYLKKLDGLDNLSEAMLPDKSKQFVNYGSNEDVLTLTLNEDLSVNMGYIASLYKILSYSKVRGKKMIPDNLLRFDMDIVVTEVRKYNRVNRENGIIEQYADITSRYRYSLYECQLYFDKMSHGNAIDMSSPEISNGFDMKINYKFSTVNFEKISSYDFETNKIGINGDTGVYVNNKKTDLRYTEPDEANTFSIDENGSLTMGAVQYAIEKYGFYAEGPTNSSDKTAVDYYRQKLEDLETSNIQKSINLRDALFEKTIQNINDETGLGSSKFNNSDIGIIASMLLSKVNIVSGFTPDGFQYNLPAYYTNKITNGAKRLVAGLISSLVPAAFKDIYANKALIQTSILMGVENKVNRTIGSLFGDNGNGVKSIYGKFLGKPINYSGNLLGNPNPDYTPPHNYGPAIEIYENDKEYPYTPPHTFGAAIDIYKNIKVYPNTPPHYSGSAFDIFGVSKIYPYTPSHTTGSPFDIFLTIKSYPYTPPHTTGIPVDIYLRSKIYPYTPPHTFGTAADIYLNKKTYPYTPPHTSGIPSNIYLYSKVFPYTPSHTSGTPFNIYFGSKSYPYTPPHTTGIPLDIYLRSKIYPYTPPHTFGSTFDIFKK